MRPKIILNCAASADGKIALPNRRNLKLSNEQDFERLHYLRNNCDAILVGIGTILEDNPSLTVGLAIKNKRNPIRIVLDTNFRTPSNAKVLNNKAETIIAVGEKTMILYELVFVCVLYWLNMELDMCYNEGDGRAVHIYIYTSTIIRHFTYMLHHLYDPLSC